MGDSNSIDVTGQRFTMLTAVSITMNRSGRRAWLCACDCGGTIVVRAADLRRGNNKSCGCMERKRLNPTADDHIRRFLSQVSPEPNTGCWLWTGLLGNSGYGNFSVMGRNCTAHRFAYVVLAGKPEIEGLSIDHLCRQKTCVNPDHMEMVTQAENVYRASGPASRNHVATHCIRGHEFNEQNTRLVRSDRYPGRIHRSCRECVRYRNGQRTVKGRAQCQKAT